MVDVFQDEDVAWDCININVGQVMNVDPGGIVDTKH